MMNSSMILSDWKPHVRVWLRKGLSVGFLGLVASLFVGCATSADHKAMVPDPFDIAKQHAQTVSLEVAGGKETNPLWTSQVPNASFQAALEESIVKSGVFSKVIEGSKGDYLLKVELKSLDQPSFGFDMTVRMTADWTLTDVATGKAVLDHRILGAHTAKMGEAFVGTKRLRLANEGAARDTIKKGLKKLSELDL